MIPLEVTGIGDAVLTFLDADVRGFTAFTQQHGDEAAGMLASKLAEIAREGVEAYGGRVIELRGDEALAVFTSARAALRAATQLQMVFADETAIDPASPLRIGIGMDSGEAVPVEQGYRGNALNLAGRLSKRAAAGEVLLSQGVVHLVGAVDDIKLELQAEAEVKGVTEPVRIYRAVVDRPLIPVELDRSLALPEALTSLAPMIGREIEARRLRWIWRLCRRGNGRAAAVAGPPGIGKTRLLAEVAATVVASGGRASYASFSATHARLNAALIDAAGPGLVVLDDLDGIDSEELRALEAELSAVGGRPLLVVLAFDEGRASSELIGVAKRFGGEHDAFIRLPPLDMDQMVQLAGRYLGNAVEAMPRNVLAATEGIPARVHEEVAAWAYAQANRRVGRLATQAAAGRGDLRSVEANLAGAVIDLQEVREQRRLFGLADNGRSRVGQPAPYRGLANFESADADFFYGRERLVAEVAAKLAGASMLGVVGDSGSGKSSVVRAGLLPALRGGALPGSERWIVAVMRPGEHPLRALDRAVWNALPPKVAETMTNADRPLVAAREALGTDATILLVVDQFEEVFTAGAEENEQMAFLAALAEAAGGAEHLVAIVPVIRSDYYGRCAAHARFAEMLAGNQVLVGPMNAEEYRRVIVQPGAQVGVRFEPELVDDLVSQVLGEPGALPLLSTTLLELWQSRDGTTIRRGAYVATGGVRGAIARLADSVYDSMDETRQGIARRILLRLAGPDLGESTVRRRLSLAALDTERDPAAANVLSVLATGRLVTVSDGSVEVAHEALLREWPRLQEWLLEDREGRRLLSHLSAAAQDWDKRKRDPNELYRGARLSAAIDWTADHELELNRVEREFLRESRTGSQRELAAQRRQNRRLRGSLAGVAALLVIAIVAASVALVQRQAATDAARQALARQLGAEALTTPRIDQAMLLAQQAVLLDDSRQTQGTLLATLLRSPLVLGTFTVPITERPLDVAVSSDGNTLAVATNDNKVRFFDTRTYREIHAALEVGGLGLGSIGMAGSIFYTPIYVAASHTASLDVFDVATMTRIRSLQFAEAYVDPNLTTGIFAPILASPDGKTLYMGWELDKDDGSDGPAYLDSWSVATGNRTEIEVGSNGLNGMQIGAGGDVTVVTDAAAVTFDGRTLQPVRTSSVHLSPGPPCKTAFEPGCTTAVSISPDGSTLTAATVIGSSLIDVKSGRTSPILGACAEGAPRFTPDGAYIVAEKADHTFAVCDATAASPIETLVGHSSTLEGMTISADGRTMYSTSLDGAIFEWDLSGSRRYGRHFINLTSPRPGRVYTPPLAMSPDSSRFAARLGSGHVGLVSVSNAPDVVQDFSIGDSDIAALAWSAHQQLAVSATNGDVQLWNVGGGATSLARRLTTVPGSGGPVAFSPDGRTLAALTAIGAHDSRLGLWDAASGNLKLGLDLGVEAYSVAVNPYVPLVAVGTGDGRVFVIDERTGAIRTSIRVEGGEYTLRSIAFRPDGVLVTGSDAGIVEHWNATTGAPLSNPILTEGGPVSALAIAPDGGTFATVGGSSGTTRIWNDASMQQFGATFPGGNGVWGNAAFTPDGSNLVVVYNDGTGDVWPVSLTAMTNHACSVAHRNLTREEWRRFVGAGYAYERTCPMFPAG